MEPTNLPLFWSTLSMACLEACTVGIIQYVEGYVGSGWSELRMCIFIYIYTSIYIYVYLFEIKVTLCSTYCHRTCYSAATASQLLGLQACAVLLSWGQTFWELSKVIRTLDKDWNYIFNGRFSLLPIRKLNWEGGVLFPCPHSTDKAELRLCLGPFLFWKLEVKVTLTAKLSIL